MVLNLADDERAVLLDELRRERFGRGVPLREMWQPPNPEPVRVQDDPRTCYERRRALCIAIDGRYCEDLNDLLVRRRWAA